MDKNKTGREAAILVIIVFLLGALLGGVGTHIWGERVWGHPAVLLGHDQIYTQLTRELQLNADQQKQVSAIMDDTRSQFRALYSPLDAQRDEIRQHGRARIRAVLTPEQQPQFEDFLRRLDEQHKKDEGR
jgi:Spy/CpxP family protein refolding chaperone